MTLLSFYIQVFSSILPYFYSFFSFYLVWYIVIATKIRSEEVKSRVVISFCIFNIIIICLLTKGQIISKGLLVSSNSPKKWTNEFVFTTTMNSFVCCLGEFEDTQKSFQSYLTFRSLFYCHGNTQKVGPNLISHLSTFQFGSIICMIIWEKSDF